MSKRRLVAILNSNPDLRRAIVNAIFPQKGGNHDNTDPAEPAQYPTAESTAGSSKEAAQQQSENCR